MEGDKITLYTGEMIQGLLYTMVPELIYTRGKWFKDFSIQGGNDSKVSLYHMEMIQELPYTRGKWFKDFSIQGGNDSKVSLCPMEMIQELPYTRGKWFKDYSIDGGNCSRTTLCTGEIVQGLPYARGKLFKHNLHTEKCVIPLIWIHVITNWHSFEKSPIGKHLWIYSDAYVGLA